MAFVAQENMQPAPNGDCPAIACQPMDSRSAAVRREGAQPSPKVLIAGATRTVADHFAVRAYDPARPPLAHLMARLEMGDGLPLGGERHHFLKAGLFESRSFSATLSSIASALCAETPSHRPARRVESPDRVLAILATSRPDLSSYECRNMRDMSGPRARSR